MPAEIVSVVRLVQSAVNLTGTNPSYHAHTSNVEGDEKLPRTSGTVYICGVAIDQIKVQPVRLQFLQKGLLTSSGPWHKFT